MPTQTVPSRGAELVPAALKAAWGASVVVRVGESGGCSATKIAEGLLLSAAHCLVGYTGEEDRGDPSFVRDGISHRLVVAEMGEFKPAQGSVDDWVLLAPVEGDPFSGIPIARLATPDALDQIVTDLSDDIADATVPLWTITYPAPSHRGYPRSPMPGGKFASRGFAKSAVAYQKAAALALGEYFIYDERAPGPAPVVPADFEQIWLGAADSSIREHHERYKAAGMPIIYHSADYSNGSSGGGVFGETTGELLGFITFGSSVISRRAAYPGFGQFFRIDRVCRASARLACTDSVRASG